MVAKFHVRLRKSSQPTKKFAVKVGERTIHFGDSRYEDYTMHKNASRKARYVARHAARENWKDPLSAGFWSKNLLWNKPSLMASIRDTEKKFGLHIQT